MFKFTRSQAKMLSSEYPIGDPTDFGGTIKNDPVSAVSSAVSIASGISGMGDSADAGAAAGAMADPFGAYRGAYAEKLNELMAPDVSKDLKAWNKEQKDLIYQQYGAPLDAINQRINDEIEAWKLANPGASEQQLLQATKDINNTYKDDLKSADMDIRNIYKDQKQEGKAGTIARLQNEAVTSQVMNSPGYMAGLETGQAGLARTLAATGQTQSGAEQVAYSKYNQDYFSNAYNDLYSKYATLSGANQSPAAGAQVAQNATNAANTANQAGWGAIAQGVGTLAGMFGS